MEQELLVRLKADGSGLVGEVRSSSGEIDKLGKSVQNVEQRMAGLNSQQKLLLNQFGQQSAGIKRNSEAYSELDDELAQFMSKVSPAYNAVKQLDTGHDLLTRSLHAGLLTQAQYNEGLTRLQAKYGPAARGAKELGQAHEGLAAHSHSATREAVHLFAALESGGMEAAAVQAAMLGAGLGKIGTGALLGGGIAVVAISAVIAAIVKGQAELERMNSALAITGGYAGMTRGQMEELAASISRTGTLTLGASKDIVTAIVASGRYGAENVAALARLTDNYAAATGQSADKASAQLIKMFESPGKASEELARQYHHLSVPELERIKTLEATGRTQEAVTLAIEKLNERLPQHAQNLGALERAWIAVKKAASGAAEAMMSAGKTPTIEEQIAEVEKRIAGRKRFSARGDLPFSQRGPQERDEALLEQLRAIKAETEGYARISADIAAARDRDLAAHKEIEKSLLGQLKTLANLRELIRGQPGAGQRLAEIREQELGIRRQLDEQRMRRLYPGFEGALKSNEASYNAVQEREYQLGQMRLKELEERKKLRGEGAAVAQWQSEQADVEWSRHQGDQDKAYLSMEARLRRSTQDTNAALITDSRERARVQLSIERRRLDEEIGALDVQGQEKRRLLEQADAWYVERQRQLTEDLKPEWQKMLEAWSDNNRLMRESFDSFVLGGLRAGEDMFVQFARTGKLTIKNMADFIAAEIARLYYRRNFAEPISSGLGGLAGLLGFGNRGASDAALATQAAAEALVPMEFFGPVGHRGGVIGADNFPMRAIPAPLIAGAPRYHGGGLASDEVPAILRRGEGVFTPQQMQALGGSTINAPLNVSIDARNSAPGMEGNLRAVIRQEFPGLLYQHRTNLEGLMRAQAREKGRRAA